MDYSTVLQEVDTWPVERRVQLMDAVWDSLVAAGSEPPISDAQRLELDARIAASEANPDDVVDWEEVQRSARRRR